MSDLDRLEAKIEAGEERAKMYREQLLAQGITLQGTIDRMRDEFRKMHEDHYVKAEAQAIKMMAVETDFHNFKGEVREHIRSRWKWLVGFGGILAAFEALARIMRKLQ